MANALKSGQGSDPKLTSADHPVTPGAGMLLRRPRRHFRRDLLRLLPCALRRGGLDYGRGRQAKDEEHRHDGSPTSVRPAIIIRLVSAGARGQHEQARAVTGAKCQVDHAPGMI
jgi:hypothetical protein